MLQDFRYGLRLLLKNKAFMLVAVFSLAIGIGANTALFSVIDAAVLQKLPVTNPDELVVFDSLSGPNRMMGGHSGYGGRDSATGLSRLSSFSLHTFKQLHANQKSLASIFAFAAMDQLNVNVDDHSEIAFGQVVSGDYFKGLGVQAERGRTIGVPDDDPAANPVAVISYRYWQRRFQSDPEAIGKAIKINGVGFTVVGITPKAFSGALQVGQSPDISIPLSVAPGREAERMNQAWFWWIRIMGRLKPGVTPEQARADLQPVFAESARDGWNALPAQRRATPEAQAPRDTPLIRVSSGSRGLNEEREMLQKVLAIFLTLLGVVLLIACANVANLLLARSAARQQEIAMRLAIGASRVRLVRQLLSESILLAVCAGVLGTVLAYWGNSLLTAWAPWNDDRFSLDLRINLNVLAFAIALSVATGILFGIMPALRATRIDLTPAMKEGARNLSRRRTFVSKTLLVAQVALSVLLLIGAGLFVRTLLNLQKVDVGFNRENLLIFRLNPAANNYPTARLAGLYDELLRRIQAVPGVRSATVSNITLLTGGSWSEDSAHVRGRDFDPSRRDEILRLAVAPNFFETLQIPMRAGRGLSDRDNTATSPKVVVVNQSFARQVFQDANPIGNYIGFGRPGTVPEMEIVGVVADAKYDKLRTTPMIVYSPYGQDIGGQMTFEVRTAGDPDGFVAAVSEAVRQVDANLPMTAIKTEEDQIRESLSFERLFATVAGTFGALALLLAGIGLYGILSYSVTRRTNEIGIRIALGADRRNVVGLVLRETMILAGAGVIAGLVLVFAVERLLKVGSRDVLAVSSPADPLTLFVVIGLMVAVAALAGFLPARRAARLDATIALRYE